MGRVRLDRNPEDDAKIAESENMRLKYFILDAEHHVVEIADMRRWAAWFENISNRRVDYTEITPHLNVSDCSVFRPSLERQRTTLLFRNYGVRRSRQHRPSDMALLVVGRRRDRAQGGGAQGARRHRAEDTMRDGLMILLGATGAALLMFAPAILVFLLVLPSLRRSDRRHGKQQ